MEKFIGVGTAMITPFKDNGDVDYEALRGLVKYQMNNGTDYLVVMGTTSEYITLSREERREVLNVIIDVNASCLPIVLGVGGNCTSSVIEEIKNTDFSGVDGILSVVPYYNKPSQEGIYQHYKAIAKISPLPIIMYNVPGRTGVNMSAQTTLRLQAEEKNLVAIKEASGNIGQVDYILRDKSKEFMVISGDDNLASIITLMGGSGVISVSSNAFPKQMSELIHASLEGDITKARKGQKALLEVTDLLFAEGNPVGVKSAMATKGLIKNNLRLPLVRSTESLDRQIAENMKTWKL